MESSDSVDPAVGDCLPLTGGGDANGSNTPSQLYTTSTFSFINSQDDFMAAVSQNDDQQECSSPQSTNANDLFSELDPKSEMEINLAKVANKLSKLIKSSESKRTSIRSRLLKGELEPHFLALEHKVVAAEHIRTLQDLQTDIRKLCGIVSSDKERKDNELKSQSQVFKEELFKEVVALLENEFSCVVCSEIFVQACVIDCGHTFCSYCINQWKKEKNECPICRKAIAACTKHVEMDNFVTKIHTLLSQDIQNRRKDLEIERENTVRIADEEEAHRPISDINEYLHEINGFYSNVRFLGHDLVSMEDRSIRNINSFLNFPVAQPSNDGVSDADMRMRQYRLMTANALISNQSSSPPRRGGPPISSDDDDDVIDDFALGLPFPRTPPRAGSPSEYLGLPVPLPVVFSPPTAVTNNNRGSMNYLRNHQQQPNQGRFCPFARSHRLGSQNPQSAHHHPLYAAMDWPIPLSQPTSRQFQQFEPPIPESGSSDHQSNRSSGYSPFYSYVEPIAHPRPQAAHANNDSFSGQMRQQHLNQVPPPAHQNSSSNGGFHSHLVRQPTSSSQPQTTSSSSMLGANTMRSNPNVNVTFNVTSNVVRNPHIHNGYGFIPIIASQPHGESLNNPVTSLPYGIYQPRLRNQVYGWQPTNHHQ